MAVLFFIERGRRRVRLAGGTTTPTPAWVTQQARHLGWDIQDDALPVRFLIHNRNTPFPAAFRTVFAAAGGAFMRTPYRAPKAHAVAERWTRSVREECLDHLLIVNERHRARVRTAYVASYKHARPHHGIGQQCPVVHQRGPHHGPVHRRQVLGGILHDYYRRAA
jgi:hypothetical protein